jgi:hypothetical protein
MGFMRVKRLCLVFMLEEECLDYIHRFLTPFGFSNLRHLELKIHTLRDPWNLALRVPFTSFQWSTRPEEDIISLATAAALEGVCVCLAHVKISDDQRLKLLGHLRTVNAQGKLTVVS